MTAGELLREVRHRHGLTQAQLAARARTSQAAISRIERDLVSPSVETLRELLDLMGEELVLEGRPVDYGFDRTLLRQNLAFGPEDRMRRTAEWANTVRRIQRGLRPTPEFDPIPALEALSREGVDFVVIGGIAGGAHGSAYPTYDLDVAYRRTADNLGRLATALRQLHATLRGAPRDLPFQLDARELAAGANFTFDTDVGPLDILGDPAGAPPYDRLHADAGVVEVRGHPVHVASLDHLIAMKKASGRPKDELAAMEYRTLSDELRAPR